MALEPGQPGKRSKPDKAVWIVVSIIWLGVVVYAGLKVWPHLKNWW